MKARKIKIGECIRFGIAFAKRMDLLKYVIAYYAAFALAGLVLLIGFAFSFGLRLVSGDVSSLRGLVLASIIFVLLFLLAGLWLNGFMISCARQVLRGGSLAQARVQAFERFPSVFGVAVASALAIVIVAALTLAIQSTGAKALADAFNLIASLIASLALFYPQFEAVANKRSALDAIKASVRLAAAKPLETIAFFIVENLLVIAAAVVSLIVALIVVVALAAAVILQVPHLLVLVLGIVLGAVVTLFAFACFAFVSQAVLGMLTKAVSSNKN